MVAGVDGADRKEPGAGSAGMCFPSNKRALPRLVVAGVPPWQKHAATLAENKIDHDSCVSSMRLLSLCSLATEHEEIPYQVRGPRAPCSGLAVAVAVGLSYAWAMAFRVPLIRTHRVWNHGLDESSRSLPTKA